MLFDKHINEISKKVLGTLMFIGRLLVISCRVIGAQCDKLLHTDMGLNKSYIGWKLPKTTKFCDQGSHRWCQEVRPYNANTKKN